jgi:hypothetical protein
MRTRECEAPSSPALKEARRGMRALAYVRSRRHGVVLLCGQEVDELQQLVVVLEEPDQDLRSRIGLRLWFSGVLLGQLCLGAEDVCVDRLQEADQGAVGDVHASARGCSELRAESSALTCEEGGFRVYLLIGSQDGVWSWGETHQPGGRSPSTCSACQTSMEAWRLLQLSCREERPM